ncbi:hypothetical protein ACS0ON_001457 [Cronobacter dublinensis]
MHDRIEERAWQDHYIQIARESPMIRTCFSAPSTI